MRPLIVSVVLLAIVTATLSGPGRAQAPTERVPLEAVAEASAYETWREGRVWDHDEPIEVRRETNARWWAFFGPPIGIPTDRRNFRYVIFDPYHIATWPEFVAWWLEEARLGGDIIVPADGGYMVFMVGTPLEYVIYLVRGELQLYTDMPADKIERVLEAYRATLPAP